MLVWYICCLKILQCTKAFAVLYLQWTNSYGILHLVIKEIIFIQNITPSSFCFKSKREYQLHVQIGETTFLFPPFGVKASKHTLSNGYLQGRTVGALWTKHFRCRLANKNGKTTRIFLYGLYKFQKDFIRPGKNVYWHNLPYR